MRKELPRKHVPCNGCSLCCQGDAVALQPEDRTSDYQTEPHPRIPGALMIAHKENGDCVYLTDHGCSIHGRAPLLCRTADCRGVALHIDFETAKILHAAGRLDFRVWDQGQKLLERLATERGRKQSG